MSWLTFLVELCAIIGGFFTVTSMLEALLGQVAQSLGLYQSNEEAVPKYTEVEMKDI